MASKTIRPSSPETSGTAAVCEGSLSAAGHPSTTARDCRGVQTL